MHVITIPLKYCNGNLPCGLPEYQTSGSSGLDLCANEDFSLEPLHRILVPCGFSVEIPAGYEAQIRPRSGLALKHGVTVLNAPGTIDSDYRGEIKVILINMGDKQYLAKRGDRIDQMVFVPVAKIKWFLVDQTSNSARGSGGFGHTG